MRTCAVDAAPQSGLFKLLQVPSWVLYLSFALHSGGMDIGHMIRLEMPALNAAPVVSFVDRLQKKGLFLYGISSL